MRARVAALLVIVATVFAVYAYQRAGAKVGRSAPGFTLVTANGRRWSLRARRGHIVLLDFWASWCEVCRADTPVLRTFAQRYAGRIDVVGIDWREPQAALFGFVQRFSLTYPNLRDGSGLVARAYGLRGVPEDWWIGPHGTARLHTVGALRFGQLQRDFRRVAGRPAGGVPVAPLSSGDRVAALAVGAGRVWLVLSGTRPGVWSRSQTGAGSWRRAAVPAGVRSIVLAAGQALAAGRGAGLLRSADGGRRWTAVAGNGGLPSLPRALAATPGSRPTWFAWSAGRLWRAVGTGAFRPTAPGVAPGVCRSARGLAVQGGQVTVAFAGGICESADGGRHWLVRDLTTTAQPSGSFSAPVTALTGRVSLDAAAVAYAGGSYPILAGPGGLYRVPSGGHRAVVRLAGSPARALAGLAVTTRGVVWTAAPDGDVYRQGSAAGPWRWLPSTAAWPAG